MVEVRDALPGDVPAVLALHARVATEGKWIGTEAPVDTARFERLSTEAITAETSHLIVATDDGRVVGGWHCTTRSASRWKAGGGATTDAATASCGTRS